MSALDRALIKAYAKATGAPLPESLDESQCAAIPEDKAASLQHEHCAIEQCIESPDTTAECEMPAAESLDAESGRQQLRLDFTAGESVLRLDAPEPNLVPHPHIDPAMHIDEQAADVEVSAPAERTADEQPTIAQDEEPIVAESDVEPVGDSPDRPPDQPFSPAWEVDALQWPAICQGLIGQDGQEFAQALQTLTTLAAECGKRILITSCRRGEGRTTFALCLAHTAVRDGLHPALVDGDFNNPQLSQLLNLQAPCDWQDAIAGRSSVSESAVLALKDQITLLPLRQKPTDGLSLAHPRVGPLLTQVADTADLVIIDAGPLDELQDAASQSADVVLIVQDIRRTTEQQVQDAHDRLQAAGEGRVLVVENFQSAIQTTEP